MARLLGGRRPFGLAACVWLCLLICPSMGWAGAESAQHNSTEDVLTGFGPKMSAGQPESAGRGQVFPKYPQVDFDLSLTIKGALGISHPAPASGKTDWRGLDQLSTRLDFGGDLRFSPKWKGRLELYGVYDFAYDIKGRDQFTSQVLDEYVSEADVGEAYIQGRLTESLDLKVGRQLVSWGRLDNIRINNRINAVDIRRPVYGHVGYLLLPTTLSRLDYSQEPWSLSAMVIHEPRVDWLPAYGNDFYPQGVPAVEESEPGFSLENQQLALAVNGVFPGWDISLYGAYLYDTEPTWELTWQWIIEGVVGFPRLRAWHNRISMLGAASSWARGDWLLKGEAAIIHGLEYTTAIGEKKSRVDLGLGIEYTGFEKTHISLELVNRRMLDYDPQISGSLEGYKEDNQEWALRIMRSLARDRVRLNLLVGRLELDGSGGGFEQIQLDLEVSRSITVTSGLVIYHSGDRLWTRDVGNNDRCYLQVRFSY